jgi:hypothetical protein
LRWSQAHGGTGQDFPTSVVSDAAGNLIATGKYVGPVSFGGTPLTAHGAGDVFAVKLSPAGDHLWSVGFGGTAGDNGSGVAVDDAGDVVLVGGFRGSIDFGGGTLASASAATLDVYVAKLDSDGRHLWSARYGDGMDQEATDVAARGTDQIAVAGNLNGSMVVVPGNTHSVTHVTGFVSCFSGTGAPLWSHAHPGTSVSYTRAVAVDLSGRVWVAGDYQGSININGTDYFAQGVENTYLTRLSPTGAYQLTVAPDGSGDERIYDIAVDGQGNLLVTGKLTVDLDLGGQLLESTGGGDGFVAKLAPDGTLLWGRVFGAAGEDFGTGVAFDGAGNAFVTGTFATSVDFGGGRHDSAGGADIVIAKFTSDGEHLWTHTFGSTGGQNGYRVAADPESHLLFAGFFGEPFALVEPLSHAGDLDVVFAKLGP